EDMKCNAVTPQQHNIADSVTRSLAGTNSTTIHSLPAELLLETTRIIISSTHPLEDLVRLSSVCRRWKTVLEGAPTLWTSISGVEELPLIRKGIELSQSLPLDIKYDWVYVKWTSGTSLSAFIKALSKSIHRWKSLDISSNDIHSIFEILREAQAPILTTLRLDGQFGYSSPEQRDLLFGGCAGLPQLSHFSVTRMTITPFQVCGLRHLSLRCVLFISTDIVCEILLNSPTLEVLHMHFGNKSKWPTIIGEPPRSPLIELPLLHEIVIDELPTAFGRFFWSAVSVPGLRKLDVGDPISDIFSSPHLAKAPASVTTGADEIRITLDMTRCTIQAGQLTVWPLVRYGEPEGPQLERSISWIRSLGTHLKDVPIRLFLREDYSEIDDPGLLDWCGADMVVSKLSLLSDGTDDTNSMEQIVPLLSQPTASSTGGWILPHLEVIETNLIGNTDIIDVIVERNSAANFGSSTSSAPKRLKEVRLSWRKLDGDKDTPPDPEFRRAVMNAADGVDVYWYGVKWSAVEGDIGT
ncbi:hypothetical protein FRB90_011689, partial [Tulasnella sp. 427]